MSIVVLAADVAAKIAAGEVVERPASVVKELVENAVDAGATVVMVEVALGGLRFVRAVDDGTGIPAGDVRRAFERHATSKIRTIDDLDGISTLGFRGEALASIAAVADVNLLTRTADAPGGIQIRIENGRVVEELRRAAPVGTTITVRNLFARIPARLKFLRSTGAETATIQRVIADLSLVYPEIQFRLDVDGRTALQTPGSGRLEDAAVTVFGAQVAREMVPIGGASRIVSGLLCGPAHGRASRPQVVVSVNRRLVQSRTLVHAVQEAYRGFLMVDRHPQGILHLRVPPDEVDVNVHPTKAEVRFRNDRVLYGEVLRTVRGALSGSRAGVAMPDSPVPGSTTLRSPWLPTSGWQTAHAPAPRDDMGPLFLTPAASEGSEEYDGAPEPRLPLLRVVGQVGLTYVITEGPDGVYLLDQHAAHERVLYDRLRRQLGERSVEMQGLLEPLALDVTKAEGSTALVHRELLAVIGFEIEAFGDTTLLVRAIPSILREGRIDAAVREVIAALEDQESGEEWRDRAAAQVACHSATRAGQLLTMEEMRGLVRQLELAEAPQTCPHGRPTLILLSAAELDRQFGRR